MAPDTRTTVIAELSWMINEGDWIMERNICSAPSIFRALVWLWFLYIIIIWDMAASPLLRARLWLTVSSLNVLASSPAFKFFAKYKFSVRTIWISLRRKKQLNSVGKFLLFSKLLTQLTNGMLATKIRIIIHIGGTWNVSNNFLFTSLFIIDTLYNLHFFAILG